MLAVLYGTAVYLLFLASFIYAIGFVGNLVPRSLDAPATMEPLWAALVNLALLGAFAVQHSLMARKGFKKWWTQFVPPHVERSTYVLFASVLLFALCWFWQPIEGEIWTVSDGAAKIAIQAVFWLGWGVLLLATFLINHFELFGLRQVVARLMEAAVPEQEFRTPLLYKHVRHPIYLGFIMAFWAAPVMSVGHLLFAAAATAYILVGIWFEERDLIASYGERYRVYREQVGMLLPRIGRRGAGPAAKRG
jgi:protein-S-isoprenylcysteine O-methyltransferase Ste14